MTIISYNFTEVITFITQQTVITAVITQHQVIQFSFSGKSWNGVTSYYSHSSHSVFIQWKLFIQWGELKRGTPVPSRRSRPIKFSRTLLHRRLIGPHHQSVEDTSGCPFIRDNDHSQGENITKITTKNRIECARGIWWFNYCTVNLGPSNIAPQLSGQITYSPPIMVNIPCAWGLKNIYSH